MTPPAVSLSEQLGPSCSLASEICEVPFVGVSIPIRDRLRFCAVQGLPASEAPPRLDFCEAAYRRPEGLYVTDALLENQFVESAWVKGPLSIRFYCGLPLIDSSGKTRGVLCVADQQPRRLGVSQRRSLSQLSLQVSRLVETNLDDVPAHQVAGSLIHEISNPLMVLQIHLQRLRLEMEGRSLQDNPFAPFQFSLRKCQQMAERIHAILHSTRALYSLPGDLDVRPVSLVDCVQECLSVIQESLESRKMNLYLNFDPSIKVRGDRLMISQIFINLCQNSIAALWSHEKAWIEISAAIEGHEVSIRVKDAGRGIPDHLHELIMQPYFSTGRDRGGTGLGLSICRGLAEKMGGSLQLDPDSAQTCFELRLAVV